MCLILFYYVQDTNENGDCNQSKNSLFPDCENFSQNYVSKTPLADPYRDALFIEAKFSPAVLRARNPRRKYCCKIGALEPRFFRKPRLTPEYKLTGLARCL